LPFRAWAEKPEANTADSQAICRLERFQQPYWPGRPPNGPFRLERDSASPAKGRIRLLLEGGLRPEKPARPARFFGRPLRGSHLGLRQRPFHYLAEWGQSVRTPRDAKAPTGPRCAASLVHYHELSDPLSPSCRSRSTPRIRLPGAPPDAIAGLTDLSRWQEYFIIRRLPYALHREDLHGSSGPLLKRGPSTSNIFKCPQISPAQILHHRLSANTISRFYASAAARKSAPDFD
jgi:hypothetical protein